MPPRRLAPGTVGLGPEGPNPCFLNAIQIVISFLLRANKSRTVSGNDLQRFEMGEFTPLRNHFRPAFTELISHPWNKEIITIFTDLFMVVYQQGTWFDVTHLPTILTNVDVASAFRK